MNEHLEDPDKKDEDENLESENEFLKMKLMLEQGAHFGNMSTDGKLPAEIENQFLKNIIEFEKQFEEHKTIKVFDKIERPVHFKPINEIPDNEIENAWEELEECLNKYGIELGVCSPNVSNRELYRFTTEELFNHEMDDMNLPGMMSCFTYDEFHPDHEYENINHAVDDCINPILSKDPLGYMPWIKKEDLRLNQHFPLTEVKFNEIVNNYKEAYTEIIINKIEDTGASIDEKECRINGLYDISATFHKGEISLKGKWMTEFIWDGNYWEITNVQIEGINF